MIDSIIILLNSLLDSVSSLTSTVVFVSLRYLTPAGLVNVTLNFLSEFSLLISIFASMYDSFLISASSPYTPTLLTELVTLDRA